MNASPEEIAAATEYENLLVPALLRPWAPMVVEAARIRPGHRVLDVACGTGILAREAARRLDGEGSVEGLDASPGMLAVAGRLAPAIGYREGVAESLPYEDGSFDAVVSQFGLMFFKDRTGALREMMRVMAPGGSLAIAVWDSIEASEAYMVEMDLLERIAGPQAGDVLRAPFALGDRKKLAALFEGVAVASLEITTHRGTARFPAIRTMVEADLRGWLPTMGVVVSEDRIQRILEEAESALSSYVVRDGSMQFEVGAHIVTGGRAQALSRQTIG
jgi:SAM-dependent methyltransferase